MRSYILTALVAALLPLSAVAQDDMYFVPTKEQVKAEKEARQKEKAAQKEAQQKRQEALRKAYIQQHAAEWKMEQVQIGNLENQENAAAEKKPTYYSGINKSVDEYNRRKVHTTSQCDTTVYSKDSIASDVIDFAQDNGYPEEVTRVDTVYKYIILDDDDYCYSRRMARWDNYYWWHNWGPWGWGRPIGWYAGWYGPWYDPFYDPWFDDPWMWGYGGWYGPYWAYDPWFYGYGWGWGGYYSMGGWYSNWYGPGFIGTGGSAIRNTTWARTGGAPAGTANHAGWSGRASSSLANHGSSSSRTGNLAVARRNGDGINATSGRQITFNGSRASLGNRTTGSRSYEGYSSNGFSGSRSSGSYSGGGYSGGGSTGGGGGFSGGGHSGGGGGGGGHFGGGRR